MRVPELVDALSQALANGPRDPAWTAWERLVAPVCTVDEATATAWAAVLRRMAPPGEPTAPVEPQALRQLAEALLRRVDQDSELRAALLDRVATAAADPDSSALPGPWPGATSTPPPEPAHHNTLSGASQVWGATVQARDISGGVHLHQPPDPRREPPRQLLPVPAHFTGRGADLRALNALRDAHVPTAPQLIVVSGPAGMGKTTLASRWLSDVASQFPDGQVYADLRDHPEGESAPGSEVLAPFLRAFGLTALPATPAEQVAAWRSLTAPRRIAVHLDNALTAAQVRPLLPSGPGSLVVVTSRNRLTGLITDGAVLHQLERLEEGAAVELLSRSVGRERVERDRRAARQVVTLCAGLPLAVCLAARPRQPLASLVDALNRERGPLTALRGEGERTVQAVLDESYRALTAEAARLYRRLGLLPVSVFSTALTSAALPLPVPEAERLLEGLVEENLLEDLGGDRFRFHDLVRLHATQWAETEPPAVRDETLRRFAEYFLATATAAEALLTPSHRTLDREYLLPPARPTGFSQDRTALAWLETNRESLLAAVRTAADAGWHGLTWQLVDALWPLFHRLRGYQEWVWAHERGLVAARAAGHRAGEARMLTSGGNGLRHVGRYDDAADWYRQALDLARDRGDRRDQAQALHGLGNAHLDAGRLDAAREYFDRALALRETIGYRRGAALTRVCLGQIAMAERAHERAETLLRRAHRELLAEHDRHDAARASAHLGLVLHRSGRTEDGERELRAALAEFAHTGSVLWQARCRDLLGQLAQDSGEVATARRHLSRSHELYLSVSPGDAARVERRLQDLPLPPAGPTGPP